MNKSFINFSSKLVEFSKKAAILEKMKNSS